MQRGFQQAVNQRFPDAVFGLGDYYHSLGEPSKEAHTYMTAAAQETDPLVRTQYLVRAGLAFSQTKAWFSAKRALRTAVALSPSDPALYQALIAVYAATGELAKAKAVIAQGAEEGVDPFPLYSALAQSQMSAGDRAGALTSLLRAVEYRPKDFLTLLTLGELYHQQQDLDRAIMWLERAVQSNPRSAGALAELADAEQSSYRYYEAEGSYRKALALEPTNAELRSAYEGFERKIRQAETDRQSLK